MLPYPNIDPVAFSIGPVDVHWYGITYLVGFGGGWWLGRQRAAKPGSGWKVEQVDDLLFYVALGVILGGRIGYMLFYSFASLIENPLTLFAIWEGGMSFHGGMLGVIIAVWLYSRQARKSVVRIMDFIAPLVPIGLGAGRLGNFIGGELWGRPTDVPWAMVFPNDPASLARHPSQLYQFALEGVALFFILWIFSSRPRPAFAVSALFALMYGIFRFVVEFFREPDAHLDFVAFNWMTMGQVLSLPMILVGAAVLWLAYAHNTFGEVVKATKPTKAAKAGKR